MLADLGGDDADDDSRRFIQPETPESDALEQDRAPPVGLLQDDDTPLEADFNGLEIEDVKGIDSDESTPEDLDLSADFSDSELAQSDDEDLVIAAESNGLSTKLDLARAYLDYVDVAPPGARDDLFSQAGLANAGFAFQQHHAPTAGGRGLQVV